MAPVTSSADTESVATSTTPGAGAATPTTLGEHSSIHEWLRCSGKSTTAEPSRSPSVTRTADPNAGDTLLIIDNSQNRALASREGRVLLEDLGDRSPGDPFPRHWQWRCADSADGFKGFQNVDTGGFLGHDIWWDFYARVPELRGWESAILRRHEGGYYWIQFLDWWTLWQVSAMPGGFGVFRQREGGTLWEFVKVHQADG